MRAHRTALALLPLAAALAAASCADHAAPTAPRNVTSGGVSVHADIVATASKPPKPGKKAPYISDIQLSSTEVILGGFGTGYTVTVTNPIGKTQRGLHMRVELVQGSTRVDAGSFIIFCGQNAIFGVLPPGDCVIPIRYWASLERGLEVGAATLEIELYSWDGAEGPKQTLDSRTFAVTIVPEFT